ncbi:MAG: hypothetical protein JSV03_13120, partial [Planctomycetota bacterium]
IVQQLYKGIFQRIIKTYPLDYYWFWTPEGWTWGNIPKPKVQHSINDMLTAVKTAKQMKTPFRLATCGWVLGPQYDRSLFDTILPKDMAVSCINRQVGRTPVDPGFADVAGRDKWAIPWLEDDPALTAAQLWVGRMRRDASDALQYGCSGLMGIHWRTRILGPNVAALAHAAWDQTGWSDGRAEFSGPIGGRAINYDINAIEGTQDDPLYQTIREGMSAYRLSVPNGTYVVTMKLCEHNYNKPKKRVFDIQIEGGIVAGGVDIFAKFGQSKAFNLTFKEIKVRDKYLDIHFIYNPDGKSLPCISAIEIQGPDYSRKINCGGPAYKDYEADVRGIANYPSTYDFYYDWSLHQFGPEAAEEIAQLFDKIDGQLPRPAQWDKGPGGLKPHFMTGKEIAERYSFFSRFARLRPRIEGAGNLERFDYWLSQFRLLQTMEILRVNWHNYNSFVTEAKKEQDPKQKMQLIKDSVIPVRIDLVQGIEKAYQDLLATVKTAGGMGNVANWEQHIIPKMLTGPGQELAEMMGKDLSAKAMPSQKYTGPARLIVPTVRTSIAVGEELKLKLIILAEKPPHDVSLYWRIMGQDEFNKVSATHVKRGVYSATIPKEAATDADFEYHVKVATDKGNDLYFPPTAPDINQTVLVMPKDN